MELWVARDEDGLLALFDEKPNRMGGTWYKSGDEEGVEYISINGELLPELTWENEPIQVDIALKRREL